MQPRARPDRGRLCFFRVLVSRMNETPQVFTLQEKAQDVSTLVVTAAERLTALDKCPFEANSMESALASLQARDVAVVPDDRI